MRPGRRPHADRHREAGQAGERERRLSFRPRRNGRPEEAQEASRCHPGRFRKRRRRSGREMRRSPSWPGSEEARTQAGYPPRTARRVRKVEERRWTRRIPAETGQRAPERKPERKTFEREKDGIVPEGKVRRLAGRPQGSRNKPREQREKRGMIECSVGPFSGFWGIDGQERRGCRSLPAEASGVSLAGMGAGLRGRHGDASPGRPGLAWPGFPAGRSRSSDPGRGGGAGIIDTGSLFFRSIPGTGGDACPGD